MSRKTITILVLSVCAFAHEGVSQNIKVQFASNKSEYLCGEPILVRTQIANVSSESITGKWRSYAWGKDAGFALYAGRDGNDLGDIMSMETKRNLKMSTPPMQYDLFRDRHWLPRNLSPGEMAERVDMLIVPKPGKYRLKAVLKERDGTVYASEPIWLQVLPLEKKEDSISKLGKQDFVINLGSSINYAHYIERVWGGYPPGESLTAEKFKELAPVIREQHKDSVFREYVMYAEAMVQCRPPESEFDLATTECGKELAEQFVKEYPRSWLLPDIYRKLFWVYVQQKNKEKAEEFRKRALEAAPNASVLRDVKRADIDELLR